jgi:superoxide dismutase
MYHLISIHLLIEHQKLDWSIHKKDCVKKENEIIKENKPILKKYDTSSLNETKVTKTCRCMFCGLEIEASSEQDAINHMEVCLCLQEQLDSKDQFTIPKALNENNNDKDKDTDNIMNIINKNREIK